MRDYRYFAQLFKNQLFYGQSNIGSQKTLSPALVAS